VPAGRYLFFSFYDTLFAVRKSCEGGFFVNILRTIAGFVYLFGYMIVHLPALHRGQRALAAGDTAALDAVTHKHVTHWCRTLLRITGADMTVTGLENIPAGRACVFVANHRSYCDILVLLGYLDAPHGLLAKQEIDKLPLIRQWMRLLGCVFVVRDDIHASMRALNAATETVAAGRSFSIFPEGTRYKGEEGGIGEFKGGAFRVATKCGAPLVPVAITGTRRIYEGSGNIMTPSHVVMHILPPIETAGLSRTEQKDLPEQVHDVIAAELSAMTAAQNTVS
jgi:1-acyl-sn-glycerol-3-phosphate acyltransferase